MELEGILSEITQAEKGKYYVVSLMWNEENKTWRVITKQK